MNTNKIILLSLAFLSFLSGCQNPDENLMGNAEYIVRAEVINDETKTAVTDYGYFTWTTGDQIWLHTTGGGVSATLRSGAGTANAQFAHGAYFGKMTGMAVYPYNENHSISGEELTVVLPAEYDLGSSTSNTNALLYAYTGEDVLKFSHMAGVMRFSLKKVPEGATQFKLTLDKKINGVFTADISGNKPLVNTSVTSDDSERTVTLNFDALTEQSDMMLYFPLPLGTYNTLSLELNSQMETLWSYSKEVTNTVNHKDLILMPDIVIGSSGPDYTNSVDLSANGTSNCYIVSEPGTYKFIPTKGNSSESVGQIASVEVLWESFGTNVPPAVGDLVRRVVYQAGAICFTTHLVYKEGNAVIAAKDASGNVLWSWHLWFVEDQIKEHKYDKSTRVVMDRNLGATSATPYDPLSWGLLYQWGRKDPFKGYWYPNSTDRSMSVTTNNSNWKQLWDDTEIMTVEKGIREPMLHMSGKSSWTYQNDDTLWATAKTKYDPCPPGWRVIETSAWDSFSKLSYSGSQGVEVPSSITGEESWYPSPGYGTGLTPSYINERAIYWGIGAQNSLMFSKNTSGNYYISSSQSMRRSYTGSIRCQSEDVR